MYPVSQRFLDAVRHPPAIYTRVEVWLGEARVDGYGDDGLPVYGGQVQVDGTKQVRRTLAGVTVDATDDMWALLSPVGTELRAFRGFTYLNGERDVVPLGRFVIPNLAETYGGDWDGRIGSAPDRMALVQRARFTTPRSFPVGFPIWLVISTLLEEVLGPVTNLSTSQAPLPSPVLYERDRGKAVDELAASIGAEVFAAPDGTPTIRDVPQLADLPVWAVDPGDDGVLYMATRERSYERTYSGVEASPAQIDGTLPFAPVTVWDTDPTSPTYYLGPFGRVPYFFTSPLLGNEGQALDAASARLQQVKAVRAQLAVDAECNPALADGDTIAVTLPARQRDRPPVVERHLISALTVPLTVDGVQRIDTRSAAPDVEDSA